MAEGLAITDALAFPTEKPTRLKIWHSTFGDRSGLFPFGVAKIAAIAGSSKARSRREAIGIGTREQRQGQDSEALER
jgi:hypothetical protein